MSRIQPSIDLTADDRPSDSPYIERVWRDASADGTSFTSIAETHWSLVVSKIRGQTFLTVKGPEMRPSPALSPPDAEFFGIMFRHGTLWPMLESVAPTLAYDAAVMGDGRVPVGEAAQVTIPTLIMTGGATFPFMHETARQLQAAMPNAQCKVIEGQTHDVAPDAIAPALIEFFGSSM